MINNCHELLQITNIEDIKEINYKGNIYSFRLKNHKCKRGNGVYIAYLYRCEKEHHNITLYVSNNIIEYAETGYGL